MLEMDSFNAIKGKVCSEKLNFNKKLGLKKLIDNVYTDSFIIRNEGLDDIVLEL